MQGRKQSKEKNLLKRNSKEYKEISMSNLRLKEMNAPVFRASSPIKKEEQLFSPWKHQLKGRLKHENQNLIALLD